MKTLKDFISLKEELDVNREEIVLSEEPVFLELCEEPNDLNVDKSPHPSHKTMDPPNVLIMRRKSIRQFPNGQRVALYYVDKIHKYVTVPYVAMQWSASTPEDFEPQGDMIGEGVVDQLNLIVENNRSKNIQFEDGSYSKVNVETADAFLKIHNTLNEENQKRFSEMAYKSKGRFEEAVNFARKHLK